MESASRLDGEVRPFARILTHLGWILGGKGYGAVLSLFYLAIVTRVLGPAAYGSFALVLSAALVLQAVLNFNVWQVLVKYGQEHIHSGDRPALARLIRFCTAVDLAMALAAIAVAGLILYFGRGLLGMPDELAWTAFAYTVVFMLSIRNVPRGVLRLHSQFSLTFLAEAVVPTLKTLGAVAVLLTRPSLELFLLLWAGSEMVSTLVFWWLTVRSVRQAHGRPSGRGWMRAWSENDGLPSLLLASNFGSMTYTITQQLPVLLVGSFAGAAEAGIYRLAHQLAQTITIMAGFIGLASYTEMTNVYVKQGLRGVAALFVRLTLITLGLFLVLALAIVLFGKPLLMLMSGPAFLGAYPFLLVLGLAACLQMATANCEPMLLAAGRSRQVIVIRLAGAAVLTGAMWFMLPAMGAIGAAWAKVLAEAISLLLLFGASFLILRETRNPS
jgi:O-antigen/teichoic acid export membrane protein